MIGCVLTSIPLFKKGNPSLVFIYRPILLTSTLCKIIETIIKNNLMAFATSYNSFNVNQLGFMHGRSTCSQLLEIQYDWCSGMNVRDIFNVITIDF